MTSAEVRKLIKEEFVPILHANGFIGAGTSFRKITDNHYIYSLTIQMNRYGGSFCVELGVFIDFIPDTLGALVLPQKVKAYDCEFRKRLAPTGNTDFWWRYDGHVQDTYNNLDHLIRTFLDVGIPFFEQFNNFPEPLCSITIEDIVNSAPILDSLASPLNLRLVLTLARIHQFLNHYDKTISFCDWGLKNIGRATALTPDFEKIKEIAQIASTD